MCSFSWLSMCMSPMTCCYLLSWCMFCKFSLFSLLITVALQNVGFIGLGNMGSRMANNLIKAGFRLTVHDLYCFKHFLDLIMLFFFFEFLKLSLWECYNLISFLGLIHLGGLWYFLLMELLIWFWLFYFLLIWVECLSCC